MIEEKRTTLIEDYMIENECQWTSLKCTQQHEQLERDARYNRKHGESIKGETSMISIPKHSYLILYFKTAAKVGAAMVNDVPADWAIKEQESGEIKGGELGREPQGILTENGNHGCPKEVVETWLERKKDAIKYMQDLDTGRHILGMAISAILLPRSQKLISQANELKSRTVDWHSACFPLVKK